MWSLLSARAQHRLAWGTPSLLRLLMLRYGLLKPEVQDQTWLAHDHWLLDHNVSARLPAQLLQYKNALKCIRGSCQILSAKSFILQVCSYQSMLLDNVCNSLDVLKRKYSSHFWFCTNVIESCILKISFSSLKPVICLGVGSESYSSCASIGYL